MRRRDLLGLGLGALALHGSAAARTPWGRVAPWFTPRLDPKLLARLRDDVGAAGQVLVPGEAEFDAALATFNKRTMLTPAVRVMCSEPQAVAAAVAWAREHHVAFAIRGGGHSYEGFSQSTGLVIDLRPMRTIELDGDTVHVGAGATLGQIYTTVGKRGLAFAAGSCADVGVAGQTFGGGFGFLARRFGLSCDNLVAVELITADASLRADAKTHPDLFWALRGAGSGSFGVATRLTFEAHPLKHVARFMTRWSVPVDDAVTVMRTWQAWAPNAPRAITSMLSLGGRKGERVALTFHGQSTDSESALKRELAYMIGAVGLEAELPLSTSSASWLASTGAAGDDGEGLSTTMKGKSDYVKAPMSDEGMRVLFRGLIARIGMIRVHCDAYGGAVGDVATDATAFPHRADTLYSLQYGSTWKRAKDTPRYLAALRELYTAMRPYVSGAAYANYPDLDLDDWPRRYWGSDNLARLSRVKAAYDPHDLFRHAQSVPL